MLPPAILCISSPPAGGRFLIRRAGRRPARSRRLFIGERDLYALCRRRAGATEVMVPWATAKDVCKDIALKKTQNVPFVAAVARRSSAPYALRAIRRGTTVGAGPARAAAAVVRPAPLLGTAPRFPSRAATSPSVLAPFLLPLVAHSPSLSSRSSRAIHRGARLQPRPIPQKPAQRWKGFRKAPPAGCSQCRESRPARATRAPCCCSGGWAARGAPAEAPPGPPLRSPRRPTSLQLPSSHACCPSRTPGDAAGSTVAAA